jgi:4-amino-4-deoxy-L-arabinose transferase-like glycosyltransferase
MLRILMSWALVLPIRVTARMAIAFPASRLKTETLYALVAVIVPMAMFLGGLNAFPLRDNNEGLYAGIAREMLESGQFIVPHLNGVPYIEKPPLLYWLASGSMTLFGPTPGAARLPAALLMIALCLGLSQFCRRHLDARIGCYASILLATMAPVALLSHVVMFDPLLSALLGGAMLCFLHAWLDGSTRALRTAAAALALAVLDKGAVALVLACGTVALYALMARDRAALRRLRDPVALALFLGIALPWHIMAAIEQEGFAWFYLVNEHILRFLGRRQPADYHHGPIWYYLPRLLLMLLPWTPFLSLVRWRGEDVPHRKAILRACQAAVLFPLLFFSASQAKAHYFTVVTAPAFALWLAVELERAVRAGPGPRLARCWGLAAASCAVLLVVLLGADDRNWSKLLVALLCLGFLTVLVVATRLFRTLDTIPARELALLGVGMLSAPILYLMLAYANLHGSSDSSADIAAVIQARVRPAPSVFIYRDFEDVFSTLPFYLRRTVPVIDSVSRDLMFGCRIKPDTACIGHAQFLWRSQAGAVAVAVRARRRDEFLAMAGKGWHSVAVGDKLVFFNTP